MKEVFKASITSVAVPIALLALVFIEPQLPGSASTSAIHRAIQSMRARDMKGTLEGGNYYEGLLEADSAQLPRILHVRGWRLFRIIWPAHERLITQQHPDFLLHSLRPSMRVRSPSGIVTTNRHGMVDREYSLEKPARTRRIALLGDSLLRGLGVPTGQSFEALWEEHLNASSAQRGWHKFECLNFGISGYHLSRIVALSEDKVGAFQPDVYILALSRLHVTRQWSDHLYQLLIRQQDARYPFLRELIRRAGVTPADSLERSREKFQPFFEEYFRWGMNQIRDQAASQNAHLFVLFLPTADKPSEVQPHFSEARRILEDMQIPVIDLLDTFADVQDLREIRIDPWDPHPNARGQELLFLNLQRKIEASPEVRSLVEGNPSSALH
jgi:lysophospholipase L1-like esterase